MSIEEILNPKLSLQSFKMHFECEVKPESSDEWNECKCADLAVKEENPERELAIKNP